MSEATRDPIFGAAVLKLSFAMKGRVNDPGFRVVYRGAIEDLGLSDDQVNAYIEANRARLEEHILARSGG